MYDVKLWVMADCRTPGETRKKYAYWLECNGRHVEDSGEITATWNGTILEAIVKGLERIRANCSVTICTGNGWILNMIENNLEKWAENDFRNYKGDEIANADKWRKIQQYARSIRLLGKRLEVDDKELMKRCGNMI